MKAYLQFGQWGGPYQTVLADGVKETNYPRNPYVTGYGWKVPTQYMVKYLGRWRRVYCALYGNIGTMWIYNKYGVETVVDIERE